MSLSRTVVPAAPWLHRFALLTAAATLALIGLGGLVTSHGVGMAVPDWPNTYGYNMFFFPVSRWVGGIFYEHTHRLLASGVGLLTSILALWLYGRNARTFLRWAGALFLLAGLATVVWRPAHWPDALVAGLAGAAALLAGKRWLRNEPAPRWLRHLGLAAFLAVVLQGVLGGLRVVLFKDQIGIFHATLAQLFFALTCALALFTSPWWRERSAVPGRAGQTPGSVRLLFAASTLLILGQLILGAAMRHQHAGLAIPDFPTAYGKLWPALDAQSVAHYNQRRVEVVDMNPITAAQIVLQMVHRLVALAILGGVAACAWLARRRFGPGSVSARLALGWCLLIIFQGLLGAATIWSNKAADIATAHVVTGALSLASGCLLTIACRAEPRVVPVPERRPELTSIAPNPAPARS